MSNKKTNKPADLPKEQTENVVAKEGETAEKDNQASTMSVGGELVTATELMVADLVGNIPMSQAETDAAVDANEADDLEKQRQGQQAESQQHMKEVSDDDILDSMRQAKNEELSDYILSGGQHSNLAQRVLDERKPPEGHYEKQRREKAEREVRGE